MREFNQAMFEIYKKAKLEAGYNATIFFNMLNDRGGLETARFLLNAKGTSAGYAALYERGRLDLTVEAMVIENKKWHDLFSDDELEIARRRLRDHEYTPRLRTDE